MKIWPIVSRLQDSSRCPTLRLVDRAWSSQQVMDYGDGFSELPAAFVALEAESSIGQYQDSCGNQVVTATVTVTLMVEAPDADYDPFDAALDEIRAALLGWIPDDCNSDLVLISGAAGLSTAGRMIWRDTYQTTYLIWPA